MSTYDSSGTAEMQSSHPSDDLSVLESSFLRPIMRNSRNQKKSQKEETKDYGGKDLWNTYIRTKQYNTLQAFQ